MGMGWDTARKGFLKPLKMKVNIPVVKEVLGVYKHKHNIITHKL